MNKLKMIVMICLFSICCNFAQSTYEQNAQSFAFDKIKLGCNVSMFLNKYKNAEITGNTDSAYDVIWYKVEPNDCASASLFAFYKKSLYDIVYIYNEDKIDKVGGIMTFMKRMCDKLSKPSIYNNIGDNPNLENLLECQWNFKNRYFILIWQKDKTVMVTNFDQSIKNEILERKQNNENVGF